jgi:hypothetical protein
MVFHMIDYYLDTTVASNPAHAIIGSADENGKF